MQLYFPIEDRGPQSSGHALSQIQMGNNTKQTLPYFQARVRYTTQRYFFFIKSTLTFETVCYLKGGGNMMVTRVRENRAYR